MKNHSGTDNEDDEVRYAPSCERIAVRGFLRNHFGEAELTKEERHYLREQFEKEEQAQ